VTNDVSDRRAGLVVGVDVEARGPTSTVRWGIAGGRTRHEVGGIVGLGAGRSLGQKGRPEQARHNGQRRKERPHGSDDDGEVLLTRGKKVETRSNITSVEEEIRNERQ